MKNIATAIFCLTTLSAGAAFAAPADAPISSDGRRSAAPPAMESVNTKINPGLGSGVPVVSKLKSEGAEFAPVTPFPANGLATVAKGAPEGGQESIIGYDSRRRVYTNAYPSRAIVFIEINGAHLCTGWMYAPNMVATAGHCVHTGGANGAWRNRLQMRVYPGRDGAASPYGSCTVARLHSVVGWTQNGDFRYDYGAMRLNCNIGNTVGWFGMYSPTVIDNTPAIISGYPGDKPRDQWTSSDKIRQSNAAMIAYRMDTIGGHSGSPVWHDRDEATAATGAWAIGVHNYGVGAFGSNTNAAARLTATRINNYIFWRNLP